MPFSPHRPALAGERVLHVGEAVAMVVAHSAAAAQDAADKIVVDYTPLDAVTDVREAVKSGAPQLWPEAPGNIGFDWTAPADPDGKKQAALDKAFKEAAHVVRVELVNQRLVVASLEPRSATASYDARAKQFSLRCPSQSVAAMRGQVAGPLNVKPDELHVAHRRRRRRLRHEGRRTSGICRAAARRARARQAGALAVDPLGSLSSATARAATRSGRSSSRSARAAGSWACASTASAISAPT